MNIAKYRKAAGMSQEQLAEKLGVSRTAVAMWETGASAPRAGMLPALAELIDCTVDELLEAAGRDRRESELAEKTNRPDGWSAARSHMVLEYAALRLARNEPLFFEIPARSRSGIPGATGQGPALSARVMEQYNRQLREELVYALCDALKALGQDGSAPVFERILSLCKEGMKNERP